MRPVDPSIPLPAQPADVRFPTEEWSGGSFASNVDSSRLMALLDKAFAKDPPEDLGETHAFLAIQNGRIVSERYWQEAGPKDTWPSWSVAKSITHALVGILVKDGLIDIHAPADVPEWQADNDPRRAITLDQLLRMSSGLQFAEDYVDAGVSHVIEMLFGAGNQDVAAYAAGFPLAHAPDAMWSYSSGTTNIVARCAARALGKSGADFEAFMRERLFDTLGMKSPMPKFDPADTFIGSSFCYCTARDFARFGLLYLRDGVWDGQRILPEGWVDYARTPTPVPEDEVRGYGAHWWLDMFGPDTFSANGYQGQFIILAPKNDLIVVRHGNSDEESGQGENARAWLSDVVSCFTG